MMIMMTKIKHDGKQLERPMSSSGLCGLMLMMMIIRFIESTTKSLQVLTLDLIAVSVLNIFDLRISNKYENCLETLTQRNIMS
jgi:hypothetical protein